MQPDNSKYHRALAPVRIAFLVALLGSGSELVMSGATLKISDGSFSPSRGEQVEIVLKEYPMRPRAFHVLDADLGGVVILRNLTGGAEAGWTATWNGRDEEGRVVPNGAYRVVVQAESENEPKAVSLSGGLAGDIRNAVFDREAGTIVYSLPAAARVLIRLGIQGGPMMKTLVDWEPRVAGSITEYWDGWDEDKVVRLWDVKGFTALVTYVTLPDATVITYGNTNETYREYKLGRGRDRPRWPDVDQGKPDEDREQGVRPAGLVPPAWSRAPRVLMSFPSAKETDNRVFEVSGTTAVRIDVDPTDREFLLQDQFEIIFYIDNVFFAEAERGYLPYNFRWETDQLPEGEHVLTVNISSFRGQVGVASRRVRVVKPAR